MSRWLQKSTLILTFLILLITVNLHAVEITVIEETSNLLRLHVQLTGPLEWRLEGNRIKGGNYLIIDNAYLKVVSGDEFDPLVPYFQWLIALPSEQKPHLQNRIISTATYTLPQALNSAVMNQINSLPTIAIAQVGWMGANPAAVIDFHPLRVNPDALTIKVVQSIEITIHFDSSQPRPKSIIRPAAQTTQAFLNSQSARQWSQAPSRALRKSVPYPSGQWYRLTITEDGIYYLTLNELRSAGLTLSQIDTSRLKIYTNSSGGRMLSETFPSRDDPALVEVTRELVGDGDLYFSAKDTLIFYGRGSSGLALNSSGKVSFERNYFSDYNYYWLLISDAPQNANPMAQIANLSQSPDYVSTTTDMLIRHEIDAVNFLHSGRFWYGEKMNGSGSSATVVININALQEKVPSEVKIRTKGATESASYSFRLFINDLVNPLTTWSSSDYNAATKSLTTTLNRGTNIFRLALTANPSAAVAYLDYIECLYATELSLSATPLRFWAPKQTGIIEYQISGAEQNNYQIYDISDWKNVARQQYLRSGSTVTFRADNSATNRKQYFLCTPNQRRKPQKIESISNIDFSFLHNYSQEVDYIIITDEQLVTAANELARLHSQEVPEADRLTTLVVTQQQILREFHGDVTDPIAIRNFLRYAYLNWPKPPSFVLLFGDGTYDYRGIESSQGNLVLTYQVEPYGEANEGFNSYAADVRFTYVMGDDRIMDLAIGRINVHNLQEAQRVVTKIKKYLLEPEYGDWRHTVTLVADDPQRPNDNEQYHVKDTENYVVSALSKALHINKLYLLEFPEVQDASTYGVKKPAATTAILNQLNKGTTIINYLGHGSPTVWAQEYVLVKDRDLGKINTGMKLPFWMGATCSWGRYDQTSEDCMPEALLIDNLNGAIGAIAATRPTYPTPNAAFINSILKKWFGTNQINRYRIGEVFQMSLIGTNENNEKYVLFGDPALFLALPYTPADFQPLSSDTFTTLQNVKVKGQVAAASANFNGTGMIKVYDSDYSVTRQYLDFSGTLQSMSYLLPGGLLYNGLVQISANIFESSFFVPKDINYANRSGKITLYGWDSSRRVEVGGYYEPIFYRGAIGIIDTVGPEIKIGFQNLDFRDGDIVSADATLLIRLSDPQGINITGQIGHDITVQFDNSNELSYTLTQELAYDLNSDTSGTILFPLPELNPGLHNLTVKAWDNANNWSTASVSFNLTPATGLKLQQVLNYPNPFATTTDFTFFLTQPADVTITIYTVRGVKIATLNPDQTLPAGFNFISWDGKDQYGDPISNGIYLYKVQARSGNHQDHFIGKMVKVKS